MPTRKTIALIIALSLTFVGKAMSLLFNTLPKFAIAFLLRSKSLLISSWVPFFFFLYADSYCKIKGNLLENYPENYPGFRQQCILITEQLLSIHKQGIVQEMNDIMPNQ